MHEFKRKPLALLLAQLVGAASLVATSQGALAQSPEAPLDEAMPQKLERITVTGSAIKRNQTEGALPVLTLDRAAIEQTGFTTATELIQNLPQVQNFVANSATVNGGGGGSATASLHALPSKYTLVLVDGQRVAPTALSNSFGGGFGANINSIPLAAVERVEILLDGASAIYGSDAIAGVVNFILKKNSTAGLVWGESDWPQHPGGGSWNAGISKGFGDLDKDGWNITGTYSFNHQDKLEANQRDFSAKGAYFPFSHDGTNYIFNQATGNTFPANLSSISAVPKGSPPGTTPTNYAINPYFRQNGNCGGPAASILIDPTGTGALGSVGESCRFNYAATVENIPQYDQNGFLGKGYYKINADTTAFATVMLSSYDAKSQYAPGAQPLSTSLTALPSLYAKYVQTFLDANNLQSTNNRATIGFRAVAQGGRTNDYLTQSQNYGAGIDGKAWGWDYNARINSGIGVTTDTMAGGYLGYDCFQAAVKAGKYDPILGTGSDSISPCILGSQVSRSKSTLNSLHVAAQHEFFNLQGGPTILALGANYYLQKYSVDYSKLAQAFSGFEGQPEGTDLIVGGTLGAVPFGANRDNWGIYGEWYVPILKNLEATASVRYYAYDKVNSNWVFSYTVDPVTGLQMHIPDADLGNTFAKTTGKISVRWLPVESLLVRGSYGTGFRAPAISDIAGVTAFNGNTAGSYQCPFPGSSACLPGSAQYDLLAGPNGLSGDAGLKPETSTQWTAGFRWEAIKGLSLGADLWEVKLKNQVLSQGIAENVGFANPTQYAGLFTNPYNDPAGFPTIAFSQLPFNGGQATYQGVDWDVSYAAPTSWGLFRAQWTGTQMLKAEYNFGNGEPMLTDLGVYGPDLQVVFRTTMQLILSLQSKGWLNSLTFHYKSGYTDEAYDRGTSIFLANPDGSLGKTTAFCCLKVPEYYTFDWQTAYTLGKNTTITFGITNLFDKDPPLTLQNGGGGNQVGYDGRYADPIGRTFYLKGAYRF